MFNLIGFGSIDPDDREAGPKSAEKAVAEMSDKEVDGHKLYVRPALRKEERKSEFMHETFTIKMPQVSRKSGIHADYLIKTISILNAIVEQNPNYK